MKTCTPEKHESIKSNPQEWARMKSLGITTYEDEGTTYQQDWRNCPECKTTMVVEQVIKP